MLLKARESDLPIIWSILQDAIAQRKAEGSEQWQNGYPSEQTARDDIAAGYGYVLVEILDKHKAHAAVANTPGVLGIEKLNSEYANSATSAE